MYVTEIQAQKNHKKRVCLDDGTDLVLYKKEVEQYALKAGEELSPEVYRQIMEEILIPRAKRRAMHLLERMDRSEAQLRDKLKDSGYPLPAIDEAISYVASYHYLDDVRMASTYIRMYQESKSRMRLTQDLRKKGIAKDVIDACMQKEHHQSQEALIRMLLEKKQYDVQNASQSEKAKMYRFLLQRGFSHSDIQRELSLF